MFKQKNRLPVPYFFRIILLLMLLMGTSIGTLLYSIRSSQPTPACLEYTEPAGEGAFYLEADPRTGTTKLNPRRFPAAWEYTDQSKDLSPNQNSFVILRESPYAGPSMLLLGAVGSEKLRQIELQYGIIYGWSIDGNTLAYLYEAYSDHPVVLIASDGTYRRGRGLTTAYSGILQFASWSADQQYFAVMGYGADPWSADFYVISTATLEILPESVTSFSPLFALPSDLVWSPSGHQFAYIFKQGESEQVRIATPEDGTLLTFDLDLEQGDRVEPPLVWSPDGRYVTLHKRAFDHELWDNGKGLLWEYWKFDIFGIDGTVHADIIGQKKHQTGDETADGWWDNGHTWIFRQQLHVRGVEENPEEILSLLIAFDVDKNRHEYLASNVAGSPLRLGASPWLAIPVWSDDKINVGLYNVEDQSWGKLLHGADDMPRLTWNPDANGGTVAAIWNRTVDGKQQTNLTWAHADGSGLHTLDQPFDQIIELDWLPDKRSLLYIATKDDKISIGVIDLGSATLLAKLDGLPMVPPVQGQDPMTQLARIHPSPSGRNLVVTLGNAVTGQDLYLLSLNTGQTRQIRSRIRPVMSVEWSADDRFFAFIELNPVKNAAALQVVSADGNTDSTIQLANRNSRLLAWAWCSKS